jgi:hypothetical protein
MFFLLWLQRSGFDHIIVRIITFISTNYRLIQQHNNERLSFQRTKEERLLLKILKNKTSLKEHYPEKKAVEDLDYNTYSKSPEMQELTVI